jgi:hypothetical protein
MAHAGFGEDAVAGDPVEGLGVGFPRVGLEDQAPPGPQRQVSICGWKRSGNSFL